MKKLVHTNQQRQPDKVDKQAQVPAPWLQQHSRSLAAYRKPSKKHILESDQNVPHYRHE